MNFLNKLSSALKILILSIYTVLILSLAVFIISITELHEDEGYSTSAKDENIQIITKLKESRTHSTSSKEESATWNLYIQVLKNNSEVEVSNIELYAKAKTTDGKELYFEESPNSSSSYKGTPTTSSSYFCSCTSKFKKQISSKGEVTDTELDRLYIKVLYDVKKDEETNRKELKYFYSSIIPQNEDFSKYVETYEVENNKDKKDITIAKNGLYNINIKAAYSEEKTTEGSTKYDKFTYKVTFNEDALEENKHLVNSSVSIFGKVANDEKDVKNIFADYIVLSEYHGVFLDQGSNAWTKSEKTNISNFCQENPLSINTLYDLSELYVLVSYTTNDGTTTYERTKINFTK